MSIQTDTRNQRIFIWYTKGKSVAQIAYWFRLKPATVKVCIRKGRKVSEKRAADFARMVKDVMRNHSRSVADNVLKTNALARRVQMMLDAKA